MGDIGIGEQKPINTGSVDFRLSPAQPQQTDNPYGLNVLSPKPRAIARVLFDHGGIDPGFRWRDVNQLTKSMVEAMAQQEMKETDLTQALAEYGDAKRYERDYLKTNSNKGRADAVLNLLNWWKDPANDLHPESEVTQIKLALILIDEITDLSQKGLPVSDPRYYFLGKNIVISQIAEFANNHCYKGGFLDSFFSYIRSSSPFNDSQHGLPKLDLKQKSLK